MPYSYRNSKGATYYLHANETVLKNGQKHRSYYFARDVRDGAVDEIPKGYEPKEMPNGTVFLKKKL